LARNHYKQDKRSRDLARQKAQEEKRLRRLAKNKPPKPEDPDQAPEPVMPEPAKDQEA